jgi:acetolactate synthase-1/2/3 large subunit
VRRVSYAILQVELARMGFRDPGPRARDLLGIARPALDFTRLAEGMGVRACRATSAEELHGALEGALAEPGPRLIEAVVQR